MILSIIIPTYNRPNDLKNCLNSILIQTFLPNEVIVVDQSENSLTKELVQSFENINKDRRTNFIWHFQKEKGSAKARNAGFRLSKGDIICFTDDDVILDKDYLKNIVYYFNSDSSIGGICGNVKILDPPSGIKWIIKCLLIRLFLISSFDAKMTTSGFGFPIFLHEIQTITPADLIAGYSMNFRREIFVVNQFDEWFTGYSFREDVELSYRISRNNKIIMVPDARFEHHHSHLNRIDQKKLKQMQFRNYYYIFNKHKDVSIFSKVLFLYSIFGIIFIDFLEFLCNLNNKKWIAFLSDIKALDVFFKDYDRTELKLR